MRRKANKIKTSYKKFLKNEGPTSVKTYVIRKLKSIYNLENAKEIYVDWRKEYMKSKRI